MIVKTLKSLAQTKHHWTPIMAVLLAALLIIFSGKAYAFDKEALKDEIKKEIMNDLKKDGGPLAGLNNNIYFSGALEIVYQYVNHKDRTNKDSDSDSSLSVGKAELGVEAKINEWVTAGMLLKAEDVGTGGNDNVFIDEALVTIKNEEKSPFYFVVGKRGQPFGRFNTSTISDPITKDAYEVCATGVTVGITPGFYSLDFSLTVYKGEHVIDQVSNIGSAPGRNPGYTDDKGVNSYIMALSMSPLEGFTIGAAFDSEPGDNSRNNTVNAFAEFSRSGLTLDVEYFAATKREVYVADGKRYRENAWSVGLAYRVLNPLELAFRYEKFNNDRAAATGDFDYTYVIGANYDLFENVRLMAEYRRLQEKDGGDSTYLKGVNEFSLQLAVEW